MTEEQKKKSQWLNRAFYAEKKVKALELLRKRDRERTQRITANYEGNNKGKSDGRRNGVEEALITLTQSDDKYDNALRDYIALRREIESAIEELHDDELEAIFMYRYLEYKTMEQIAECMNYNERTIRRKHHYGIEKLSANVLVCPP